MRSLAALELALVLAACGGAEPKAGAFGLGTSEDAAAVADGREAGTSRADAPLDGADVWSLSDTGQGASDASLRGDASGVLRDGAPDTPLRADSGDAAAEAEDQAVALTCAEIDTICDTCANAACGDELASCTARAPCSSAWRAMLACTCGDASPASCRGVLTRSAGDAATTGDAAASDGASTDGASTDGATSDEGESLAGCLLRWCGTACGD